MNFVDSSHFLGRNRHTFDQSPGSAQTGREDSPSPCPCPCPERQARPGLHRTPRRVALAEIESWQAVFAGKHNTVLV